VTRRTGLLNLKAIKAVLKTEDTPSLYVEMREGFRKAEPALKKNLEYWIIREIEQLRERFEDLNSIHMDWVGHLLERYFIRGFNMHRKIDALRLGDMFAGTFKAPPGFEPEGAGEHDREDPEEWMDRPDGPDDSQWGPGEDDWGF